VLIGVANFEDGHRGVAFVLDLTERKRAADAVRALQMELAHANRLATMGQLTASISHEVNQPIGATRNNAHAALRFLAEDPPDLEEVREAIECVVKETYRAGEILGGIRDQVKKVPPRMEALDLNATIEGNDDAGARRSPEAPGVAADALAEGCRRCTRIACNCSRSCST
jgi:C4-dicarboxylate-specific signal transduction histidine kinase